MNSNQISKAVRLALVAGAVSALATPAAFAADAAATATTTDTNQSTAQLGKIEVTGTRIKRTDVETAQPVTIVTQKEIKATGLHDVGDILATLPQVRAMLNAQVNNGNNGQSTIDLRNLGSQRVLVLVNGRRWVTDIANKVDFTTIPAAIIDHIEILQDGASAIYGSDAISGVVNVITVKNYNGAEANAYNGWYHGDGHTDGKVQTYDFTFGTSGDKSAVLMSIAYTQQDGALAGDRNISKEPYDGTGTLFGSSRSPGGRYRFFPTANINGNTAGVCPGGLAPNSNGYCDMTLKSFPAAPSLNNFRDWVGADHYNFAPLNYLIAPGETTNLYTQGHYDLADNLTFTSEALFTNRSSQTQLAQPVLDIGNATTGFFTIDKTNPYNPFHVNLVSNSNDPCIAAGSCDLMLDIGRRFAEAGPRVTTADQNTFHYAGGFKGYFNMAGGEWDWDANYVFNRQDKPERESNVVDLANLGKALGPAFNAGTAAHPDWECGTPDHPVSNPNAEPGFKCVPTNMFGGAGSITPDMVTSDTMNPISDQGATQRDYTANMTGDLFDLPAGPVGLAFGFEYLESNSYFYTDEPTTDGDNAENQSFSTVGRERTDAEYVEFNIPILTDQPFAKDMNLDVAERWSQFKWQGGVDGVPNPTLHTANASTGRAALKWQTTDSLLLRASWSQGFRLPTVSEFFGGTTTAAVTVQDPCVTPSFASSHPNCGGLHSQPNTQITTFAESNPDLNPEKSTSRTIGFVYNPDWAPGFDFSADYYKIEVNQFITLLNDATILANCYSANIQADCALIKTTSGEIVHMTSLNSNIGGDLVSGVDISTHYKFPSTSVGDFKLGFDMTFLRQFDTTLPNPAGPGGFATSNLAGWATQSGTTAVSYPKRKGDLTLSWNFGPWSAQYMLRYTSDAWEACDVLPTTAFLCTEPNTAVTSEPNADAGGVGRNHLGSVTYHDINGTYHADSLNADFTVGIRNLFGKNPPISSQAFANSYLPQYDTPGQFFYARIGVKF